MWNCESKLHMCFTMVLAFQWTLVQLLIQMIAILESISIHICVNGVHLRVCLRPIMCAFNSSKLMHSSLEESILEEFISIPFSSLSKAPIPAVPSLLSEVFELSLTWSLPGLFQEQNSGLCSRGRRVQFQFSAINLLSSVLTSRTSWSSSVPSTSYSAILSSCNLSRHIFKCDHVSKPPKVVNRRTGHFWESRYQTFYLEFFN